MQPQGHVLTGRTSQGLDDVHTPGLLEASGYPHSLIRAQRPSFPLPSHHAGFPAPAGEGSPRPHVGPRPQTPGPRIFWFLLDSHREETSGSPERELEQVSYPLVEAGSGATSAVKEEAPASPGSVRALGRGRPTNSLWHSLICIVICEQFGLLHLSL